LEEYGEWREIIEFISLTNFNYVKVIGENPNALFQKENYQDIYDKESKKY